MTVASQPRLIYFADVMCSWCYAFAPAIDAMRAQFPDLPIELINGGLKPGPSRPMNATDMGKIRPHWEKVQAASGLPMDFGFFDRIGFVYDTEPAARAVVVVRQHDPAAALAYFQRLQQMFYAEAHDVTDPQVLAEAAREFGVSGSDFLAAFADEDVKIETATDFQISQRTGVTGFPTLIAGTGAQEGWSMITQGYQTPASVLSTVARWLAAAGEARTDA